VNCLLLPLADRGLRTSKVWNTRLSGALTLRLGKCPLHVPIRFGPRAADPILNCPPRSHVALHVATLRYDGMGNAVRDSQHGRH
jgi:hypothetical protein